MNEKVKSFFTGLITGIITAGAFICGIVTGILHHRRTDADAGDAIDRAGERAAEAQGSAEQLERGVNEQRRLIETIKKQRIEK